MVFQVTLDSLACLAIKDHEVPMGSRERREIVATKAPLVLGEMTAVLARTDLLVSLVLEGLPETLERLDHLVKTAVTDNLVSTCKKNSY